jgi:hypothetical protein
VNKIPPLRPVGKSQGQKHKSQTQWDGLIDGLYSEFMQKAPFIPAGASNAKSHRFELSPPKQSRFFNLRDQGVRASEPIDPNMMAMRESGGCSLRKAVPSSFYGNARKKERNHSVQ